MAYDRRPPGSPRSYRNAHETLSYQYPSYRPPYAETISDYPSNAQAVPSSPSSRYPTHESAHFMHRDYPRAPRPASHRSTIGTNSYMGYDTDMLDTNSASTATVSIHSSISQRPSRRSPRQDAWALDPAAQNYEEGLTAEDFYQGHQNRLDLHPTPVRQQRTFEYEQEPVMRSRDVDEYQLRTRPGSYQELPPSHYGMVLSRPFEWNDSHQPRPGPPTPWHPEGSRDGFTRPFLYESGRPYRRTRSETTNCAGMPIEPPDEPPSSRRDGEDIRREHRSFSRAYHSASRSQTYADLRQCRDDHRGQVVELRTPGGTTIRIVEEEKSE